MNFKSVNNNGTVEGFCLVKTLEVKKTAKGLERAFAFCYNTGATINGHF